VLAASMPSPLVGGHPEVPQPPIQHFETLDGASTYLCAGDGGRALGFFSSVESAEHTVFLTVAKQVANPGQQPWELTAKLGRATIGRGTQGASVYMVPRSRFALPNGSYAERINLVHKFVLPTSSSDATLRSSWRRLQTAPRPVASPPPSPPPDQMWQELLEAEALALHRFIQAGALPDVSELSPRSIEPLSASAAHLGLFITPTALDGRMRKYHLRRLARVAARFSPLRCGEASSDPTDGWPPAYNSCELAPKAEAIRFVHANASAELVALLGTRFGISIPSAMPPSSTIGADPPHVRFALLSQRPPGKGAAAKAPTWHTVALDGVANEGSIEAFVQKHSPKIRTAVGQRQGVKEEL
jgi:hypothetical protein